MAWEESTTETSKAELEEGENIALDFSRFFSASGQGVLPAVAQDVQSGEVLVL